jgi:hypothetical protein
MTPRSNRRLRRRLLPLRRGYSLAAVFLLVATIAVLTAMARSVFTIKQPPWEVFIPNLIIGLLGGALIGGTVGIHYERRVRSTLCGILVGGIAGQMGAAITVADFSPAAAFINCGVLILLAVFVRLTTATRTKPSVIRYVERPAQTVPLSQARRGPLVAAIGVALCAIVGLGQLIAGSSAVSGGFDWKQAVSQAAVAVLALLLASWLFWTAVRKPAHSPVEKRTSPWD